MFEVSMDGEQKRFEENTNPVHLDNVKVMAGDNYYEPLDGKIRNIAIQSKRE